MKQFYIFISCLLTCFGVVSGYGQTTTTLISNDCSSATAGWTFTNGTTATAIQQGGYWLLENADVIITTAIDVSTYTSGLELSFNVATFGAGSPDKPILVQYSLDNGGTWETTTFVSATPSSSSFIGSGIFSIAANTATQFKLRFTKASSGGRQGVRLDDILFVGKRPAVSVTLSDNGTAIAAGIVPIATQKHIIGSFKLNNVGGAASNLTQVSLGTTGNYTAADISRFKLWSSATNNISTATQLGTSFAAAATGTGESISFTGLSQPISTTAEVYYWVTADLKTTATIGRTIQLAAIANTNLTFSSGTKAGSASISGIQTITTNTNQVTLLTPEVPSFSFANTCVGSNSAAQSFNIETLNQPANFNISAPTHYQVSLDNASWLSVVSVVPTYNGPVYVRFAPTGVTSGAAIVSIAAGDPKTVAVTGASTAVTTPTVSVSPTSASNICVNANQVSFTASVANNGSATSAFQWKDNAGNISGAATATLSSGPYSVGTHSITVNVTLTGGCLSTNNITSTPVTFNVYSLPTNPSVTQTPACGSTVLTTAAAGANQTVYWQTLATNTSISNPNPHTVSASATRYLRVYNSLTTCWSTATTVNVTVAQPVNITTQPTDRTVSSPANATFTVAASGYSGLQWQLYDPVNDVWNNVSNGSEYTGATSTTLTVLNTATNYSGRVYRCLLTATNTPTCPNVLTDEATLIVNPGPCINEEFGGGTTAPSGWSFTGITGTYTTGTNFGNSSPSVRFDDTNDRIVTSILSTSATQLSFWMKGQGTNATSELLVEGFNGTTWITIEAISNIVTSTSGVTKVYNASSTPALPDNLVQFRFTYTKSAGNLSFDDVVVNCSSVCISSTTISNFIPAQGPANTLVTINGTDFNNVTAVDFSGQNATIVSRTNSTMVVKVPVGAPNSSIIHLKTSTCNVSVAIPFSVLSMSGNCQTTGTGGGSITGLFIAEVFDSQTGNIHYVKIFNGTGASVNLSTYSIRLVTIGSACGTNTTDISLSGTVANNSYYTILIGSATNICSLGTINLNPSGTSYGYNGNDYIQLLNGATVIDRADNPGYGTCSSSPGFVQIRKSTVTGPSATFNAAEWTNTLSDDCSLLGTHAVSTTGSNLSITVHPTDINCGALTLSTTATVTPASTINYVWYFNKPGESTWQLISSGLPTDVTHSAAGLPSITLTGNIAGLQDYQFYCEVSNGSPACKRYTNAAVAKYTTQPYYRTAAGSGNWTDISKWQISADGIAGWASACIYPNSLNSQEIRIGHTGITLDLPQEINKLWVQTSGSLEISVTRQLSVSGNVTGAEYIIDGTVLDRSNSANSIIFNNNSKWQMGTDGTLIKTNNSSVSNYRDNYEGGIASMPATANWVYWNNGDGNVSIIASTASVTMNYPNLYFVNSAAGTALWNSWNPPTTTTSFNGANPVVVKGSLNIGNTFAGVPSATNPVTVHTNITGTGVNGFMVLGNLNINSGSTLSTAPNINQPSIYGAGIEVQGNITNNGILALNNNTEKLLLSGTGNQTISGTGTYQLYSKEINKASGRVNVSIPLTISNQLLLTSGIIETSTTSGVIILPSNATYTGGSNTSFVQGNLRRYINGTNTLVFPVGHSGYTYDAYQPLTFIPGSTTNNADYFTASFTPSLPPNGLLLGPNLMGLNKHGYWAFDRNSGGTTNGKISLNYSPIPATGTHWYDPSPDDYLDPASGSAVLIAKRENGPSFAPWNFTYYGTLLPNTYTSYSSAATIETQVVNSFSLFSFGISGGSVLPVKLLSFNAVANNKTSQLNWELADVGTLAYSQVEYSLNGIQFMSLDKVNAVQGKLQYHYNHGPLTAGIYYYRILFVEKDGSRTYSAIRTVTVGDILNTRIVGLSQTTIRGAATLNVQILLRQPAKASARITNNSGQVIYQSEQTLPKGNVQMTLNLPYLPAGVYYVHVLADGETKTLRFLSTN